MPQPLSNIAHYTQNYAPLAEKRRSSWTNLIQADENKSPNGGGYTKFANAANITTNTTLASNTNSPDSSKNGSAYSLPQKSILSAQSLNNNGSVVYANRTIKSPQKQSTTRQNSLAQVGFISDFFSASKGSFLLQI